MMKSGFSCIPKGDFEDCDEFLFLASLGDAFACVHDSLYFCLRNSVFNSFEAAVASASIGRLWVSHFHDEFYMENGFPLLPFCTAMSR